jgi:uncharacterized membrane protein
MGRFVLGDGPWMTWNVALALLPLLLAVVLCCRDAVAHRSPLWWAGFTGLVLFLPNAPYVLTDAVHLGGDLHSARPSTAVFTVVLGMYSLLFAIGVVSYVLSLHLLGDYLTRAGWTGRATVVLEVSLHAACAIGIYLGRFPGLNSWDVVRRPGDVASAVSGLASPFGAATVTMLFVVLAVTTTATRWMAFGAAAQLRRLRTR